MSVVERAHQIWPVLAWAARNRQVITYAILGKLIGVPQYALGQLLEPIQSYCLLNELPPLTILVVKHQTGMPGVGFIAAQDIPKTLVKVFDHDWLEHGCPTVEEFEDAVRRHPSNGV
jgi:hypothetical protein